MSDVDDYVDVEPYSPRVRQYTCWNCGYEGLASSAKAPGAIICRECYHGQGEDRTDYLALWYPDLDRESAAQKQAELRAEMRERDRHSGHVEVRL